MSRLINKTVIAAGVALAVSMPVHALDDLVVDGYVKNSPAETWHSSDGECVRTDYQDSQEYLEACGYERVTEQDLHVESETAGEDVSITETTAIVKSGEVLADKTELVAETFIKNLVFAFDKADLTAADEAELADVAAAIATHRPLLRQDVEVVEVIGHTDSQGSAEYNEGLSVRRATTVADYLAVQAEVPRTTLNVIGRGESEPIATNDTDAGRATNRRVEIRIRKK